MKYANKQFKKFVPIQFLNWIPIRQDNLKIKKLKIIRVHILEFQVFITTQCSYNAIFCKIFPSSSFFLLTYWQDYLVNWNSHFHSVVGHLRSKNKYGPYSNFTSLLTFFTFSPKFDFLIFIYYLYSTMKSKFFYDIQIYFFQFSEIS